jgi:D-alanyl-lipoteichoic acid acyltransferase DltB (MBOAT superfamily)
VHLLPQVERIRRIDSVMVIDGIWLIILGYLKKTVIADRIAEYSDQAFSSGLLPFEGMGNWLCLYAFAIQIYGDFSGYSDIARGLSKIMGFDLMVNFRAPYLVSNPPAFWQNWHISLSTWLRDYLYIPLGGNRHGQPQMYRNLMITMILGGLWHRAAWACLIWGIYQGALLVVHRAMLPTLHRIDGTLEQSRWLTNVWKLVSIVVFFHLTCIGWLIFRVGSTPAGTDQVAMITDALRTLFTPEAFTGVSSMGRALLFTGALTFLVQWKDPIMESFHTWKPWPQAVSVAFGMLLVTALGVFDGAQFIYFQF